MNSNTKRLFFSILGICVLAAPAVFLASCQSKGPAPLPDPKEVRILYTSDVRGEFEPCG